MAASWTLVRSPKYAEKMLIQLISAMGPLSPHSAILQSNTAGDAIRGLSVITTHGQYFIQFMASEWRYSVLAAVSSAQHLLLRLM